MGQEGPAGPPAQAADHSQVAPLLTEFTDVFSEPVVPQESWVIHNIDLLNPDA